MWALVYIATDSNGIYQRSVVGFYKNWQSAKKHMYEFAAGFYDCDVDFAGDFEIDLVGKNGSGDVMLFIDNAKHD